MLLPGVISHATNVVEHPELVAERLIRLARLVGPENVIASTDCGFAQGPFGRRVHPSIMWAKLRALSEGAAIANRTLAASVSAAGAAAQPASFGDERVRDDAPMEDEEKILAGRTDANIPALLTKDVKGG